MAWASIDTRGDYPSQTNFFKNPSNYTIENYVREIRNVKNKNNLPFPELKTIKYINAIKSFKDGMFYKCRDISNWSDSNWTNSCVLALILFLILIIF